MKSKLSLLVSALALALLAMPAGSRGQAFTTLYRFSATDDNGFNTDGAIPLGVLEGDANGGFYGTTSAGGSAGGGTVFLLTPAGKFTLLHTFDPNTEGSSPGAGLLQYSDGTLFGTTYYSFDNGADSDLEGTVFSLTPAGVFTTVNSGMNGGEFSQGALIIGFTTFGNRLYGTTFSGGVDDNGDSGTGMIFSIDPAGDGFSDNRYDFRTEYLFLSTDNAGSDYEHGYEPSALTQDFHGNLYGTTFDGGPNSGHGTIFSFTEAGTLTTLYTFTGKGRDGGYPGAVIAGSDNNLYGTTEAGTNFTSGVATIFSYVPGAAAVKTLYTFTGGADGKAPVSALATDYEANGGHFYGTTEYGGNGYGTIFSINPQGQFVTLYRFTGGADGAYPVAALVVGDGVLYGTTTGGANGSGTIFQIIPTAPAITSAATDMATIGQAFSYQITATNNPTSYGAAGLPAGLTLDANTGLISGTPTATGTSSVTLSATNADGTGTGTLSLTVVEPVPIITSASTGTANEGQGYSYQIKATNNPTSYAAKGLPGGVTVNPTTGLISGSPYVYGTFTVSLSATNSYGTGTGTLTLTVNHEFYPAIITSGSGTIPVNQPFSAQIKATNNPTSYGAQGLPAKLTLNAKTGLLSGTPTVAGVYPVKLTATNGFGTGSAVLTLKVENPATVPTITSSLNPPARQGVSFSYQITASNSPTSYAASGVPAGLTIHTDTGKIDGHPSTAGTYNVTISASNSAGTGSATLTLVVKEAVPAITSSLNPPSRQGVSFGYQITATNSPTSYAANGLPTGLSISTSTGKISGTPTAYGTYNPTISATNSGGTGSAQLSLVVKEAVPVVTSSANPPCRQGVAFSYQITATNNPTSYAAANLPAGLTLNAKTGVISGHPTKDTTYQAKVQATNSGGTGELAVTFTVKPPV